MSRALTVVAAMSSASLVLACATPTSRPARRDAGGKVASLQAHDAGGDAEREPRFLRLDSSCILELEFIDVDLRPGTTAARVDAIARAVGGRVGIYDASANDAVLRVPANSRDELMSAVARLESYPEVKFAAPRIRCKSPHTQPRERARGSTKKR